MGIIKKFDEYPSPDFTIFCDLDGCLTDFEKKFREIPTNRKGLNPTEYDKIHGKFSMWKLIDNEGVEWWSDMEWMPDGKKLWEYISQFNVKICSSPSRQPDSLKGKIIWIRRELGIDQESATISPKLRRWEEDSKIILNSEKFLFNKRFPNSILIDDTPNQVDNWRRNGGGIAILHKSADETIKELSKIISKLK